MRKKILYIERKTGFGLSHGGPAWIGEVEYSKSGNTVYFNDMALKKLKTAEISSNHFDIETGEEYWISGFKKNGQDRHVYGGGIIMIDEDIVQEYLEAVDFDVLDTRQFEIIKINKIFDKGRFNEIENNKVDFTGKEYSNYVMWYWDNNRRKLVLQ